MLRMLKERTNPQMEGSIEQIFGTMKALLKTAPDAMAAPRRIQSTDIYLFYFELENELKSSERRLERVQLRERKIC